MAGTKKCRWLIRASRLLAGLSPDHFILHHCAGTSPCGIAHIMPFHYGAIHGFYRGLTSLGTFPAQTLFHAHLFHSAVCNFLAELSV